MLHVTPYSFVLILKPNEFLSAPTIEFKKGYHHLDIFTLSILYRKTCLVVGTNLKTAKTATSGEVYQELTI